MEPAPEDLDVQAYCRSLALQQVRMLTRLAEIAMQLAEAEGARALAAQVRAAEPKADDASTEAARAEAREAGLAFSRFSNSVQRSLAQRARAADRLCARDRPRPPSARPPARPAATATATRSSTPCASRSGTNSRMRPASTPSTPSSRNG